MSATAVLMILCDECEDAEIGTPFAARTHREVRAHNKRVGWRRTRNGRDICPTCAATWPTQIAPSTPEVAP